MKRFITKQWKQILAVMLVIAMMIGMMPQGMESVLAAEAQSTTLNCLHTNYSDQNQQVVINMQVEESVTIENNELFWSNSNKMNIDGKIVNSTDWYYTYVETKILGIRIPYSMFKVTSEAELKEQTHTFMIPKGEVIAEQLTVAEDVYFYLDSTGSHKAQSGTISYSGYQAINNDATYRIWIKKNGVTLSSWEYKAEAIFDGTVKKEITLYKYIDPDTGIDSLYFDIPCSTFEKNASKIADVTGQHTLQIPKGTVMGDIILQADFNLEVSGGTVTKGPDVILQPSVYGASSGNAGEINLLMNQDEALSSHATNWTQKSFNKGGISFNGVSSQAVTFSKQGTGSKLFTAWFNNTSKDAGTIMTLDGDIKENDYLVRFARTHFKYNVVSGAGSWSNYTPTELSITGIFQSQYQENNQQYLIYLKTSAEVPGKEGHAYPVTVSIDGVSSTQWAEKVADNEQDLWLLVLPKSVLPVKSGNVNITVKANKEIFGTKDTNCEIVNLKSDFTFYYRSSEFAATELFWLGDINDDGDVDVKDIVRLKLYLKDSSSVQIGSGADADKSGTVDDADRIKLYDYILKGEKVRV